jgi:pimeloyl-ACP methyl ester carboxylesterase
MTDTITPLPRSPGSSPAISRPPEAKIQSSAQSALLAPLAHFNGLKPPAPAWFEQALAARPERSSVAVQDASIETLSWGKRGLPGVLLMHGNSAHADWYSFIAPQLANDYRVVAMSFSGMGNSSWREHYSAAQWADEALAVAEHTGLFDGTTKPVFVGHSFGGFPLMNASARFGDRLRLAVIADTPIQTREDRIEHGEEPRRSLKAHRSYSSAEEAIARFRLLPPQTCENLFILDHIARTSIKPASAKEGEGTDWTWKFDPFLFRSFSMGKPGKDLSQASCPVAWINGARSSLITDKVRANIQTYSPSGSRVIELPNADHHLMIDQPLAFIEALRALISSH